MTEEQIQVIRSYWENMQFVENASPEDVQSDVLAYLDKISALQQQNKQLIEALEEIKDEEWRLAGEFTTIYTTAYDALRQIAWKEEES